MQNELLTFERSLYRAVVRFKQEHPGVLEARTEERRQRREMCANRSKAPEQRLSGFRV